MGGEVRSLALQRAFSGWGWLILQNPESSTVLFHLTPISPRKHALFARSEQSESLTSFILIPCQFINSDLAVISMKILLFCGPPPPGKSHRARTFAWNQETTEEKGNSFAKLDTQTDTQTHTHTRFIPSGPLHLYLYQQCRVRCFTLYVSFQE